jgi:hypothetical protein
MKTKDSYVIIPRNFYCSYENFLSTLYVLQRFHLLSLSIRYLFNKIDFVNTAVALLLFKKYYGDMNQTTITD